jgi:hypothetical protein
MEIGTRDFENIPPVAPETRREVFEDLKTQINEAFGIRFEANARFLLSESTDPDIRRVEIRGSSGVYHLTRNTKPEETEITIDRVGKNTEKPLIILESIRFKYGNHALRPNDPLLEYHRTLKKGGSRTISDSVIAISRIEKFIKKMGIELAPTNGTVPKE